MSFESGQKVFIRPGTFHNTWTNDKPKEATFVSYMAGRKYAILTVRDSETYNIRVNVEDLDE